MGTMGYARILRQMIGGTLILLTLTGAVETQGSTLATLFHGGNFLMFIVDAFYLTVGVLRHQ